MKKVLPKVSFIIPTLNADNHLKRCLEAIRNQDYPQKKVEIIVADGGSKDRTIDIARAYGARIIKNKEVLHEPGKALATSVASGEILFFTDADNQIVGKHWITSMVIPYLQNKNIVGFLPQTVPPPKWNSFDRYLGYLATDPFTWFVYRWASSPYTYPKSYIPINSTKDYKVYKFNVQTHPIVGLSQGFGTVRSFKRKGEFRNDDMLSGIQIVLEGGLIVHPPQAKVYHYHVESFTEFVSKYTWRIRNNFYQKVPGMGLVNRQKYLNSRRKLRQYLFPLYSASIILPVVDTISLYRWHKNRVVLWHPIACIVLSMLIVKEVILYKLGFKFTLKSYGSKQ